MTPDPTTPPLSTRTPEARALRTWLFGLQRFGMKPGLDTMRTMLAALARPERAYRSVLIAGTNGKGSTARVLANCLQAAGRRVGLYTSPHLIHLNERVEVDGVPVPDDVLDEALRAVRPVAERVRATFFEVVTAAAMVAFERAGVQDVVFEVGLGGRYDSTNVVTPALSLITGVALDHTAILGPDLASIAVEKAGILRPGVPAFTAATGEARRALTSAATVQGVELHALADDITVEVVDEGWDGLSVRMDVLGESLQFHSALVGRHQARNIALAAYGALTLGVPPAAIRSGVASARWPGRLERLPYAGRYLVLDGAHNAEGAAELASTLRSLEGRVPVLIVGMSADKDVEAVGRALSGVADQIVATRTTISPRSLAPEALAVRLPADVCSSDLATALAAAVERVPEGGTIVVAGSLFLVGEARALALGIAGEGMPLLQ